MKTKKRSAPYVGQMNTTQVAQMDAHRRSGAAGIHSDQVLGRRTGTGRTNRVGSRSSARREAVRQYSY